jgi:hypothetical protein
MKNVVDFLEIRATMFTGKTIVTDWCANELILGGHHD